MPSTNTNACRLLLMLLSLGACQDLSVDNENSPDRTLTLAAPKDVEALVAGTFIQNWSRQDCAPAMLLTTMADENSSSWSNWGMRDMSSEPRIAWNNAPTYLWQESIEGPWFDSYAAISSANDGLQAVAQAEQTESVEDNTFTRAGVDTGRLKAFAKFNQAWAHSWLALFFDRAFIVDEDVDLEEVALGNRALAMSPYSEVMAAAHQMMEEAIALAQAQPFTIEADEDWIFGLEISNEDLIALARSMQARWLAAVARTPEERAGADWNQIMSLIVAGITEDFAPIGDDNGLFEWDCMKFYGSDGETWSRMDYRTIGPADESGGYQNWLASPVEGRRVFDIHTGDRRIVGDAVDPTVDGKYTEYWGLNGPFPAARGTYHYSSHTHRRWRDYLLNNANGLMPYILVSEMDLLQAEGLLRTGGSMLSVAGLINKTRVAIGELNPATASDPIGNPSDEHSHLDSATLWARLKYEKHIETFQTAAGLAFFDDRGWGDLLEGTPIHFPVPGVELETLGLQQYTFGGVGGPGAALKTGAARSRKASHPR